MTAQLALAPHLAEDDSPPAPTARGSIAYRAALSDRDQATGFGPVDVAAPTCEVVAAFGQPETDLFGLSVWVLWADGYGPVAVTETGREDYDGVPLWSVSGTCSVSVGRTVSALHPYLSTEKVGIV